MREVRAGGTGHGGDHQDRECAVASEMLSSSQWSQVSLDRPKPREFYSAGNLARILIGLLVALARIGVLVVVCAAPWWFGGVEPDIQFWLYSGLLISLACWLVATGLQSLTVGIAAVPLPTVLAPVLAALLLGSFQLWPTNDPSIGSPTVVMPADFRQQDQAGPLPAPSARTLMSERSAALSICPAATRVELARLVMAIIAVYLGTVLFANAHSQIWLWACLASNGAALAFFGIAQQLSWNGKLFWTVPLTLGGQPFASYVNRNNAAGYLNLCLAAAWGFAFWWLTRAQRETGDQFGGKVWPTVLRAKSSVRGIHSLLNAVRTLDGRQLAVLTILTLVATGIVCSLSRGGVLAMVIATTAVCGLMARARSGLRIATLLVGVGLLGAGLVIWSGLAGRVGSRWELVSGESLSTDARLANWSDALRAARDFPVTGTGFGTYRYAYLPYQTWPATVHFHNADNQFVEGMVEGGLVGLGLILLSVGLSLAASLALARAVPADPVAVVGLFTVISQCVSASFDFGPSLSANMLAFALIIGAVTGRAAWQCGTGPIGGWLALPVLRPAWMTALVGVALLAHGTFGLGQVSAAAASRTVRRELPRLNSATSMSESSLAVAIQRLQAVVARQPDDAEAHRVLAELWIYRYRLQALEVLAAQTRASGAPADWNLTDPVVLYLRIHDWIRSGDSERVDALRNIPQVRDNLVPAWSHLSAAQTGCPLMPEIDLQLAMLAFVRNPREPVGEAHLQRAVLVSPGDPDLLIRCGTLAQAAGLSEFSHACWHRSLELAPDRLHKIRHLWMNQITLDQELQSILPDSPELLLSLASVSYAGDEHRAIRHALVLRAQQLLEVKSGQLTESERLHALARCSVLRDDPTAAVDYYRQLLVREPLHIEWRLELVGLLHQQGKYQAALDQAELCQAMAPDQAAIRERVNSLRQLHLRQPAATTGFAAPAHTP